MCGCEWIGEEQQLGSEYETDMGGGKGTALIYNAAGLITCEHVLRFAADGKNGVITTDFASPEVTGAMLTIKNPVTGDSLSATVVHRHAHHALVILRFDRATPHAHRYFVGLHNPIKVHAPGVLIGFPTHTPGTPPQFLK